MPRTLLLVLKLDGDGSQPVLILPMGLEMGKPASLGLPPETVRIRVSPEGFSLETPDGGPIDQRPVGVSDWIPCDGWQVRAAETEQGFGWTLFGNESGVAPELEIVGPGDGKSRRHLLSAEEGSEVVLGRATSRNDPRKVTIHDPSVSRRHCRIFVQGGWHVLEDLGSTHRTRHNGREVSEPVPLHHQDRITIGDTTITYVNYEDRLRRLVRPQGSVEVPLQDLLDPPVPSEPAEVPPEPDSGQPLSVATTGPRWILPLWVLFCGAVCGGLAYFAQRFLA